MEVFKECLLFDHLVWCLVNGEERFAILFIDVLQVPEVKINITCVMIYEN